MDDRRPKIRDVLIFDEKEYVIRAMVPDEGTIVLTLMGIPSSSVFLLKGAQLNWQDTLQAWSPVNLLDFYEVDEPPSDS